MRVLFLTQTGPEGPASRYRVYQLVPLLEQRGIACTVSPGISDDLYRAIYHTGQATRRAALTAIWRQRRRDLRGLDEFDAVFVQKGVLPGLWAGIERKIATHKPMVFDFDDAVWLPKEGGSRWAHWLHRETTVQEILRGSSAVIAGNEFLAGYARRFNPQVTVVPSAIDLSRYPCAPRSSPLSPRIGWIGSRSTMPYLKPLKPVFEASQIAPIVIASGDPSELGFPVDFRQWTMASELEHLREIDIGISPLPDTPWEHGKCGVKLLQYMACKIPAVASPVGVHSDIIQHGVNGFLAETTDEWVARLQALLTDADLRHRLGMAARRTVEERFDLGHAAAQVAAVLRSVTR